MNQTRQVFEFLIQGESKGRYESKFTGQLVKFRPITVEIKLVKPIKFAFASSRQSRAHSPSDHHWLFYHVYVRFKNCEKKLMGGL